MPDVSLSRSGNNLPRAEAGCCDDAVDLLAPAVVRAALLALAVPVACAEVMPATAAAGRVLAVAPHAARDLPPFDQSAMDGYALPADALLPGALPALVRVIPAGADCGPPLRPGTAVRVLTGAALPAGTVAVAMEEHAAVRGGAVALRRLPAPGANIRRRGEDVAAMAPLVAPGTRLDARHLALLAAAGVATVAVRRRVRVALLSNGNELRGAIHDSNRPMLAALLARPELACCDLGILPDERPALGRALAAAAAEHDLILASGGISGSGADHLPEAARDVGGTISTPKLALKPGRPLAFGRIEGAVCLFLPGNPLAALVGMLLFGRPVLARLSGAGDAPPAPVAAIAGEAFARFPGREEFLPACIAGHDPAGLPVLTREGSGGSARLAPLAGADGLLWLPAGCAAVAPGDALRFLPFSTSFGL